MDTIKRVQDLMQERDMNLCVLTKKCGISYSTIQSTARRGGQLSVEDVYKRQNNFTAPQAVECSHDDAKLRRITLNHFE